MNRPDATGIRMDDPNNPRFQITWRRRFSELVLLNNGVGGYSHAGRRQQEYGPRRGHRFWHNCADACSQRLDEEVADVAS